MDNYYEQAEDAHLEAYWEDRLGGGDYGGYEDDGHDGHCLCPACRGYDEEDIDDSDDFFPPPDDIEETPSYNVDTGSPFYEVDIDV